MEQANICLPLSDEILQMKYCGLDFIQSVSSTHFRWELRVK